jgi:hypothetical protein
MKKRRFCGNQRPILTLKTVFFRPYHDLPDFEDHVF